MCCLSYLCFILQHLIQKEEDTDPNTFSYASCSIFDLSHRITTLFYCLHSLWKILVHFPKKKQKYKRKSRNTFSHGWCSIYVPSHCIETLLRSAAPGVGSGKGEQNNPKYKYKNKRWQIHMLMAILIQIQKYRLTNTNAAALRHY